MTRPKKPQEQIAEVTAMVVLDNSKHPFLRLLAGLAGTFGIAVLNDLEAKAEKPLDSSRGERDMGWIDRDETPTRKALCDVNPPGDPGDHPAADPKRPGR